jgi:hypothetical protein
VYRVKWDSGESTKIEHQLLEPCPDVDDHEDNADDDAGEDALESHTTVDDDLTDDEAIGLPIPDGDVEVLGENARTISMGSSVTVNDVVWTRVPSIGHDTREAVPHFDLQCRNWTISQDTTSETVFWKCMPVSRMKLLEVVQHRAQLANCKYTHWREDHIDAALTILIGGAQYKTGTDLWATTRKGMVEPPDFGRFMSKDRFARVLRYWARGPEDAENFLGVKPWGEVDWFLDGFNESRYPPPPHSTPQRPHSPMLEGVIE